MGRMFSIDRKLDLVDRKLDWVGAMLTRSNTEHEHATLVPLRILSSLRFCLDRGWMSSRFHRGENCDFS